MHKLHAILYVIERTI